MSFLLSTIKSLAVSPVGGNDDGSGQNEAAAASSSSRGGGGGGVASNSSDMRFNPPSPNSAIPKMGVPDAESDFNQWLHAMKMVASLPGGMPPDFRRKLWSALANRYIESKGVDWRTEEEKCFSENYGADDEELGIQIVKDLHRTGSSLCSGPAGQINQAKLKRILLGYSRWNPEVGYCQGFNMLGALILQVMDKNESDAIKVMIFLIEGLLPAGYFCGSLGGLQADMAVFRELLANKLPRLARHLQKLQGPAGEHAFEPPLTNVFTMNWFLTLFCTCLPINCVLRVWDLILIEGSDVLLRTALALWGLLEPKIMAVRTADEFYCKMGVLSGELLNGTLTDSNGLVQRIVDLGKVEDLQKMREKHLATIAPLKEDKKRIKLFYSDDDGESDEESKLAVATAWGGFRSNQNRRHSQPNAKAGAGPVEGKDRIALDINILKKQYNKLRERQRQAHVILTAAVQRPPMNPLPSASVPVNQLLAGKSAIMSTRGRRILPAQGMIPPPARGKRLPAVPTKKALPKPAEQSHRNETEQTRGRGTTMNWKEAEKEKAMTARAKTRLGSPKRKSESSSYSEESDIDSSTSTSLCDDHSAGISASSLEGSPLKKPPLGGGRGEYTYQVPEENRVENLDRRIADLTEAFEGQVLGDGSMQTPLPPPPSAQDNKIQYERLHDDDDAAAAAGTDAGTAAAASLVATDDQGFTNELFERIASDGRLSSVLDLSQTAATTAAAAVTAAASSPHHHPLITSSPSLVPVCTHTTLASSTSSFSATTTAAAVAGTNTGFPLADVAAGVAKVAPVSAAEELSKLMQENQLMLTRITTTAATTAKKEEENAAEMAEKMRKMSVDDRVLATSGRRSRDLSPIAERAPRYSVDASFYSLTKERTPSPYPQTGEARTESQQQQQQQQEAEESRSKGNTPSIESPEQQYQTHIQHIDFSPTRYDSSPTRFDDGRTPERERTSPNRRTRSPSPTTERHSALKEERGSEKRVEFADTSPAREEKEVRSSLRDDRERTYDSLSPKDARERRLSPREERAKEESNRLKREESPYRRSLSPERNRENSRDRRDRYEYTDRHQTPSQERREQDSHKRDFSHRDEKYTSKRELSPERSVKEKDRSTYTYKEEVNAQIAESRLKRERNRTEISFKRSMSPNRYESRDRRSLSQERNLGRSSRDESIRDHDKDRDFYRDPSQERNSRRSTRDETYRDHDKDRGYRRSPSLERVLGRSTRDESVRDRDKDRDYHRNPSQERSSGCSTREETYKDRDKDREYRRSPSLERGLGRSTRDESIRDRDEDRDYRRSPSVERGSCRSTRDETYRDRDKDRDYRRSPSLERGSGRSTRDETIRDRDEDRDYRRSPSVERGSCRSSKDESLRDRDKDLDFHRGSSQDRASRRSPRDETREESPYRKSLSPGRYDSTGDPRRSPSQERSKDDPGTSKSHDPRYDFNEFTTCQHEDLIAKEKDLPDIPLEFSRPLKLFSSNKEIRTPLLRDSHDINAKISSINDTIKSINALCRMDPKLERTYRTIEEICDRRGPFVTRKGYHSLDTPEKQRLADVPLVTIESASSDGGLSGERIREDRELLRPRSARERSRSRSRSRERDVSPRRAKTRETAEEFEARVARATAMVEEKFDKLDRFILERENERFRSLASPKKEDYDSLDRLLDKPERLDIRHSTVTSTLYDRYLYSKREKGGLDKSPSSPVITRAYLDSLRPAPNIRIIKSAENSPSRTTALRNYSPGRSSVISPVSSPQSLEPFVSSYGLSSPAKSTEDISGKYDSDFRCSPKQSPKQSPREYDRKFSPAAE